MSDEEDLLKLKRRYEKGEIPKSRYDEERAWILGTASLLMPGGDMEENTEESSMGKMDGSRLPSEDTSRVSEGAPVITVDDVCRMKPAAEEKKEAKETDLDSKYAEDEAAILGKRASSGPVPAGETSPVQAGSHDRTKPDKPKKKGKAGQRGLAVFFAVFLWPAAIFYIAKKKPFPKWLNILLIAWSFAATVAAAAWLIVYFKAGWKRSSAGSGPMSTLNSTASSVTAEVSKAQAADSYSVFLAGLDSSLRQSYGNDYILSDNGKELSISIWKNGIAAEAEQAISDGGAEMDNWTSMRSAIQTLADTIDQALRQTSDLRHVRLNLLNDTNTDNVLLSFYDAECIYDAVEDASGSTPYSSK